jgi:exopolyphosphatase
VYFAAGLGSTYYAQSSATPRLANFLSSSKARYLSDIRESPHLGERWTIAMGNEAAGESTVLLVDLSSPHLCDHPDLDSIASAIAFSWIETVINDRPTIPLIQTYHDDLPLRQENLYALSLAGIHDPESQLLTLTDFSNISTLPTRFALLDHNRLGEPYLSPSARVTAVIDHHEDEELYVGAADPRVVAPSGSCASHVAALAPPTLPSDLATLLLSAILIDTGGLKPGGKALPVDLRAANFLASRSLHGPSPPPKAEDLLYDALEIQTLTATLLEKKKDVIHLSTPELLRRDYKEYVFDLPWLGNQTVRAGISTVPLSLSVLHRDDDLGESMMAWMVERRLSVLGVSTSFTEQDQPGHKREFAWIVHGSWLDGVNLDEFAERLWTGFEECEEVRVGEHQHISLDAIPAWARTKTYQVEGGDASRKVTAPLLRAILQSP